MGVDFRRLNPAAAALFEAADQATGLRVSSVVNEGPLERLTDTAFAQPAVVATSLAALAALRERLGTAQLAPAFCAGHSVGELAALAAAGSIDAETALGLVATRSRLMAEVCDGVNGSMAAVIGLDEGSLHQLCREASEASGETVELACVNAPDQLVVSGHQAALDWLQSEGPARGARRIIRLAVSGPFHSVYMRPAAAAFAKVVAAAELREPAVPVVLNQTARATLEPAEIRRELGEQIAAPVRWADSLRTMCDAGCTLFVEVGPGQVLAGLVRRTLPFATVVGVQDEASLEQAVVTLREVEG